MTERVRRVSVIGLGKLGAPLAACLAAKGFCVIGVDEDPRKIQNIQSRQSPVYEPGLQELLSVVAGGLAVTQDIAEAVRGSDATFIVVATPSEATGEFSLRSVLSCCEAVGLALRDKSEYHLVVLTSTVMPGSTGGPVKDSLEKHSGKRCGEDFGLCYNPEFIALGSVIRDFLNPDFLLVGESDRRAGDVLVKFYEEVCDNAPPVVRMSFINAELTKLSVNAYVTTKITFANMLARLCERLPDANVDEVTSALGLDRRIGPGYLKGAISYGGPCFPRDNVALSLFARELGAPAMLAEATDAANRQEINRLVELVKNKLPPSGVAGILGLAYKPDTDVTDASPGRLLAEALLDDGIGTIAYDPAAMVSLPPGLKGRLGLAASVSECIQQSDVVVIATPWEEFKHIDPVWLKHDGRLRVIVDCWRILDRARFLGAGQYIPLGLGPERSPSIH